ncbi:MAG TPA: aminotransferase class V-fold PLP-dependent enzyme [Balneolales bacterium]|nr:aminotransferase class V-fold PLP-dependent enzyme [Balneolales bacterium]
MDNQKNLFSFPDDFHYLNCSYMSPLLKSVEKAGIRGIRLKREPWRVHPDDFFSQSDTLRELFAQVIHSDDPKRIAIIPSVSYGMANVAQNLPKTSGKNIVVAGEQFPSNYYPWLRYAKENNAEIRQIKRPDQNTNWNEIIMQAIDQHTLLVALGNVHWTDGYLFDLKTIAKKARSVDAYFVIDGTQSVGALPFNIEEIKPDALICAGYKWLMGPYAIGMAYFGKRFDHGIPVEENWLLRQDSEDFSQLVNYTDVYQPKAIRYDMGERSNFILVPMMFTALQQIINWGVENIQEYCCRLTDKLSDDLDSLGYTLEQSDRRAGHILGIRLPDHIETETAKQVFSDHHISVSFRSNTIRISPNVYNTLQDIEAMRLVLRDLVTK